MPDPDAIAGAYRDHFGRAPCVVARAPGRVNIIGEHTDYNDGLALPFAIEQSLLVAAATVTGNDITVHSMAKNETVAFTLSADRAAQQSTWQNYMRGVVFGLRRRGVPVCGAEMLIGGDLPSGCGVSSSAALCVAAALALLKLVDTRLPPLEIAGLAQQAEHDFAGTPCGIMDPYVSLLGKAGHALLLDCRSITHEYLPLDTGNTRFVLIDSGVARELSSGLYAQRVQECQSAAARFAAQQPALKSLRDVTLDMLACRGEELGPVLARRVRHVVSENARVLQAREALVSKQMPELGRLLRASHESLRDDYETSCAAVDELVSRLDELDGVLGARMVGGGSGGMVLALIESDALTDLHSTIERHTDCGATKTARIVSVSAAAGAGCL